MQTVILRVDYTHSHMNRKGNVRDVRGTVYIPTTLESARRTIEVSRKWITDLLERKDVFNPVISKIRIMQQEDMDGIMFKAV